MTADNVAYIYTRKPKRGEKVGWTERISDDITVDIDGEGKPQGVELLNVHEIWVNGRVVWPRRRK